MTASERALALQGRWLMGRLFPHQFMRGVERHLRQVAPGRERELVERIRERSRELVEQDSDLAVDGPAVGMLAMSAVVLASYETLRPELDGDGIRTIVFLQRVMGGVLRRSTEIAVGFLARRNEPRGAVEGALEKSSALFGASFDFAFQRPDPETFEMRVERCFFRDFFARHDALLVTTVLCAWDANWMASLDPPVSGLRADRPTLLSLGDDACRFRVLASEDPLASHADALERRFTE